MTANQPRQARTGMSIAARLCRRAERSVERPFGEESRWPLPTSVSDADAEAEADTRANSGSADSLSLLGLDCETILVEFALSPLTLRAEADEALCDS